MKQKLNIHLECISRITSEYWSKINNEPNYCPQKSSEYSDINQTKNTLGGRKTPKFANFDEAPGMDQMSFA